MKGLPAWITHVVVAREAEHTMPHAAQSLLTHFSPESLSNHEYMAQPLLAF